MMPKPELTLTHLKTPDSEDDGLTLCGISDPFSLREIDAVLRTPSAWDDLWPVCRRCLREVGQRLSRFERRGRKGGK